MFLVTVHDPYSEHPHLSDEEFRCETVDELARSIEEVTGMEPHLARINAEIVDEENTHFSYTLPENDAEVTAHRVGEPVGSAA